MVCEKCEKKLSKVIVPDKWKEGASNTTEGGGRKINENKLLSKKNRFLYSISGYNVYGPLTETLSAPFASSKCTRMLSTATPVLTLKEFVQCVESKFLIPSFTNKAMCSGYLCCIACCIFF
ncbi:Cysteine-rich PDZ-binding protein [Glycine max]|nr:Cysteine-rich PDZ-binding protein [Glycine max]